MNFLRTVRITGASQIALVVFGLIYSIVASRYLGKAGYGILATLLLINATAVQFGNLGMHAASTYFIGKERALAPKIASNALWFSLVVGSSLIISVYLLTRLGIFSDIPNYYLVFILLIPFSLLSLFLRQILLIENKIYAYSLVDPIVKAVVLLLAAVLLVTLNQGLLSIIFLLVVTGIISTLVNLILVRRGISFSWVFDFSLLKKMYKYAFGNYMATLFAFLIIRSDLLLVKYFCGDEYTGDYAVSVGVFNYLYLLPVVLGSLLFPKVSSQKTDRVENTLKLLRHLTLIMSFSIIPIYIFAKPLILLLYGETYQAAIEPFTILLPGLFFLSLVTILNNDLIGRGMVRIIYIAPMICFFLNFGLNLWLIPTAGLNGAAFTSAISYFVWFLLICVYFLNRFSSSLTEAFLIKPKEINIILNNFKNWRKACTASIKRYIKCAWKYIVLQ